MNRKIISKGFYQHENGSKTITLNGETIKGDWVEASRIVGYIVPTSTYSSERKEEYYSRIWYDLND